MASRTTFILVNLLYLLIVGAIVIAAYGFGGEASIVSLVIGVPTLIMIVFALGSALLKSRTEETGAVDPEELATAPWPRAAVICAWLLGFFIVVFFIGFYPSMFLFTLGFLKLEGKTSWLAALAMAVCVTATLYGSFDYLMGQELFEGILFDAIVPVL